MLIRLIYRFSIAGCWWLASKLVQLLVSARWLIGEFPGSNICNRHLPRDWQASPSFHHLFGVVLTPWGCPNGSEFSLGDGAPYSSCCLVAESSQKSDYFNFLIWCCCSTFLLKNMSVISFNLYLGNWQQAQEKEKCFIRNQRRTTQTIGWGNS